MWEGLTVGGFQFDDSMEYAAAKKEYDIINFIAGKMDINNPQVALKVYYKLLERKDMKTVIGLAFLKQLRDFCVQSGVVEDSQIKIIPILNEQQKKGRLSFYGDETSLEIDSAISESASDMEKGFEKLDHKIEEDFSETEKALKRDIQDHVGKEKKLKQIADFYRSKVKKCYYVIAGLAIIILVLFILAIVKGNTPFSSNEEDIQNKYATWAEELAEKEADIIRRENELKELTETTDIENTEDSQNNE